jgi:hypothetical protein
MSKTFTTGDVAAHNKTDDLFIIIDGDVYDLTKFQDDHPGMLKSQVPERLNPNFHCALSWISRTESLEANVSGFALQAARRSSNGWPARTPPSNSGSTTMKAS